MIARPTQTSFADASETEAARVLRCAAWRAGPLANPLVELAIRVSLGAEFEVQRAALEELLQRFDAVEHEQLAIRERLAPGWFIVASHRVWVGAVSPIEASCDCIDYRNASLGACTHVLAALRELAGSSRRLAVQGEVAGVPPVVRWNPIRPLSGPGDWLDRVWWASPEAHRTPRDPAGRRELIARLRRACARERFVEPALPALVEREWLADVHLDPAELERSLEALREPLFEYQREGVRRFFETGRMLLGDDMGLGKTAQAIAIGHVLLSAGRIERIAVIVPSPLKWQWANEWSRFAAHRPRVVDGPPAERHAMYRAKQGILILSYEQLRRDRAHVQRFDPELVILDEAQRIKNAPTQTARSVKRLAPRWRLALTGTPLENRLEELASIVEWIDDLALEPRWRLVPWHTVRADGQREAVGMRDLGTLRERIAPYFVRRVRAEVLRQLPSRRDTSIPVPLTDEQDRSHHAFELLVLALLEHTKKRPLTREEHLRLMQLLAAERMICSGLALKKFTKIWPTIRDERATPKLVEALFSPKLVVLSELLTSLVIEQQRKVVVFSQWRRMLQLAEWATRDLLGEAGVRGMYFSGQESARRRVANLVRFHDLPDVRVLWATDAGAVGLNLQRAASCCINLELPWNPAVLEQRIGRIYRLGQRDPVDVYNLVGIGGIEERIERLIGDKRALFTELFDGCADSITFGQSPSKLAWILAVATPSLMREGDRAEAA